MRNLLGIIVGAILFAGGGWMRWCPSPPEFVSGEAGAQMVSELGIVLLALGTFLIGAVLNRLFAPAEW